MPVSIALIFFTRSDDRVLPPIIPWSYTDDGSDDAVEKKARLCASMLLRGAHDENNIITSATFMLTRTPPDMPAMHGNPKHTRTLTIHVA